MEKEVRMKECFYIFPPSCFEDTINGDVKFTPNARDAVNFSSSQIACFFIREEKGFQKGKKHLLHGDLGGRLAGGAGDGLAVLEASLLVGQLVGFLGSNKTRLRQVFWFSLGF